MPSYSARPFATARQAAGLLLATALAGFIAGCGSGSSGTPAERIERAAALQASGSVQGALVELKTAAQDLPESPEIRVALGRFYLDVGAGQEARNEIAKAEDLGADLVETTPLLVRALLQLRKLDDARAVLKEAEPWDEYADLTSLYADTLVLEGDPARARVYYEDALRLDAEHAPALLALARIAIEQDDLETGEPLLARARAAAPVSADVRLLEGELALRVKDNAAALRLYGEAAKLNPYAVDPLIGAVRAHIAADRIDEARTALAVAERNFPANLTVSFWRGVTHYISAEREAAIDEFRKVLTGSPTHAGTLYYLGVLMMQQNKFEQADDYLQAFLRQYPGNLAVRKLVATVELRRGRPQAALDALGDADDDDAALLMLRGTALNSIGRIDEGLADMQRAAGLADEDELMQASLVMAKIGAGQGDDLIPELEAVARGKGERALESAIWVMFTHLSSQRWDDALTFAASLTEAQRAEAGMLNAIGMAHAGKQAYDEARAAFTEGLRVSPGSRVIRRNLAEVEMRSDDLDVAAGHLDTLMKAEPKDPDTLTLAARIAQRRGKPDEAIGYLEQARSNNAKHADSRLLLGPLYLQRGDAANAAAVAREALALRSGDVQAMLTLAEALSRTGKLADADEIATYLAEQHGNTILPVIAAGTVKLRRGQFDAARRYFTRAMELDPGNAEAAAGLAVLAAAGTGDGAQAAIARLAAIEGESVRVHTIKGDVAMRSGDHEAAAAHYGVAFAASPDVATGIRFRFAQMRAGRRDEAIAGLEQLLEAHPGDADVLTTLGPMYEAAGRTDDALAAYERILESRADSVVALNNAALLRHRAGDASAEALASRAYELAPDDANVLDTYGWILATKGKNDRATTLLQRAYDASDGLPAPARQSIRYHYAVALARFGDRNSAVRELRGTLETDDGFPERKAAEDLLDSLAPGARR